MDIIVQLTTTVNYQPKRQLFQPTLDPLNHTSDPTVDGKQSTSGLGVWWLRAPPMSTNAEHVQLTSLSVT